MKNIPFNRPFITGNEYSYISDAIINGVSSGNGDFTKKCHFLLEEILGVSKVFLTTSCTHALEMAALLLDIQQGDEVIVPTFTFVSTANAFALRGAKPVFIDIRSDTLNMDEKQLESKITTRTKAIIPVHYAGIGCEMDGILDIATHYQVEVIEDNAHGLFGKYKDTFLGTFGTLATLSFHETKNITCGEGGALLINDNQLLERAEILWEKGTNRSQYFRGQVDKYTWVDLGSSYLPSDILAAFLLAQLEEFESIQSKRKVIWERYNEQLIDWAIRNEVKLPFIPKHCDQSYHMFYLLLPTFEHRQMLIQHLKTAGISSVFHYVPLHISKMGKLYGGNINDCPIAEDISERLLRLPFFNDLTENDQSFVINTIKKFNIS